MVFGFNIHSALFLFTGGYVLIVVPVSPREFGWLVLTAPLFEDGSLSEAPAGQAATFH